MQKYKGVNSRSSFCGHCFVSALFSSVIPVSLILLKETQRYHPNTEKLQLMKSILFQSKKCMDTLVLQMFEKILPKILYEAEVLIMM